MVVNRRCWLCPYGSSSERRGINRGKRICHRAIKADQTTGNNSGTPRFSIITLENNYTVKILWFTKRLFPISRFLCAFSRWENSQALCVVFLRLFRLKNLWQINRWKYVRRSYKKFSYRLQVRSFSISIWYENNEVLNGAQIIRF